jgi:rRNA-processing protein FCF1
MKRGSARHKLAGLVDRRELSIPSIDVCANALYPLLGLTDAAIATAAKLQGCSVLTNDSRLFAALATEGVPVLMFNHLRQLL